MFSSRELFHFILVSLLNKIISLKLVTLRRVNEAILSVFQYSESSSKAAVIPSSAAQDGDLTGAAF